LESDIRILFDRGSAATIGMFDGPVLSVCKK
jgi:hypothetical protein